MSQPIIAIRMRLAWWAPFAVVLAGLANGLLRRAVIVEEV